MKCNGNIHDRIAKELERIKNMDIKEHPMSPPKDEIYYVKLVEKEKDLNLPL